MAKREIRAKVRCGSDGEEEILEFVVSLSVREVSIVADLSLPRGRKGYPISISLATDSALRLLSDIARTLVQYEDQERDRALEKSSISK